MYSQPTAIAISVIILYVGFFLLDITLNKYDGGNDNALMVWIMLSPFGYIGRQNI